MIRSALIFLIAVSAMFAWASLMSLLIGGPHGGDFNLGIYIGASLLIFTDLIDLLVRFGRVQLQNYRRFLGRHSDPAVSVEVEQQFDVSVERNSYAIVLSVYNLGVDVNKLIAATEPFRDRVWIIDDASEDDTFQSLRDAGIRAVHGIVNRHKPGALKRLLDHLPEGVNTVVVLDPDSLIVDTANKGVVHSLERVLKDFQRSGAAALCPALRVRRGGLLERFQTLEYALAFELGRRSLSPASITSGIAVYRRDALETALQHHSLSVYAEDLENTIRLLQTGEIIYYDSRLVVETEVPGDLRSWFSQRVGWAYGLARVYLGDLPEFLSLGRRSVFNFYSYVIYMGLFTIAFHPIKVVGILILLLSTFNGLDNAVGLHWIPDNGLTAVEYAQLIYLKYMALSLIAWTLCVKRNSWYALPVALLYPFYGIGHLIPTTVGFANWLAVRYTGRRIYRDHYASDDTIADKFFTSRFRVE